MHACSQAGSAVCARQPATASNDATFVNERFTQATRFRWHIVEILNFELGVTTATVAPTPAAAAAKIIFK